MIRHEASRKKQTVVAHQKVVATQHLLPCYGRPGNTLSRIDLWSLQNHRKAKTKAKMKTPNSGARLHAGKKPLKPKPMI